MELLDITRLAMALVVCSLASYSDWKRREASDLHWIVLGAAGLVFIAIDLAARGADPLYYLFLFPIGFVFLDFFWDRKEMFEDGVHPLPIVLYALSILTIGTMIFLRGNEILTWQLTAVIVMFAFFALLYWLNVIKGGADAKALIALSIVFPFYPIIGGLPLIHIPTELASAVFPFSLLILFNAALLSISIPVGLFLYNLARGDVKFPAMMVGYRTSVDEALRKFVWPMERAGNDKRLRYFPKEDDDEKKILEELKQAGAGRIWVTPKIPFLIPITIGIVFSAVIGNIVMLFLH
ncbi:MAG: A24 family peptidase C-terminal domain-containing protein [Methanomassiliicoccales archaeon]|jgi:preflagellin peptidase FlaK